MCDWSDLEDLWCRVEDNITAGFHDDFFSEPVVFGPELPPPSWSTKKVLHVEVYFSLFFVFLCKNFFLSKYDL